MGFNKICLGEVIQTNTSSYKKGDCWAFVNYLDTGNITENVVCEIQRIDLDKEPLPSRAKRKVQYNSIIYSTVRPNQRHYGIIKNIPQNFLVSTGFTVIDAIPEKIDADFLFYLLTQRDIIESLQAIAEQSVSTYPSISPSDIENLEVWLPELSEQKKIAAILSALDEKIATNRAINDNLQQQAASIFAEWLNTCTDFSTIGDMAHNILDYFSVASEQIRLLNSSDVTEGVFPVVPLVPNKDLKGHFKKRFQFGDILYSEIRPRNHHYGLVLFDASDYIASTRLMVIRAIEKKVSPVMLYQYLLLPEVEAEFTLKTESRSGTFPQGNYADMASIQVPYSPTNSQTAVSEILSRIRFAIAQNQFESQRLAELRDTLLPKLMSGEIDVSAVQP